MNIFSYKHVFDGLYKVGKREGIPALFNGVQMATLRAVLITNGQVYLLFILQNCNFNAVAINSQPLFRLLSTIK